jgi:type IV secretory pathway VirB10-like protein
MRPSNFAVIGASNDGTAEGPTAASLALRDQVAEGEVSPDTFTSGMRRRLSKAAAVTAHFVPAIERPAVEPGGRRDASPSAAPVAPAAPAATAVHPAPPPPEPSVVALPVAPPQRLTMADEDQMSEQDRRRIQTMLATMGYYSGRIDGTFGPETRAAIRRYQFEIKSDMTGRLSAEQATRLANSVR